VRANEVCGFRLAARVSLCVPADAAIVCAAALERQASVRRCIPNRFHLLGNVRKTHRADITSPSLGPRAARLGAPHTPACYCCTALPHEEVDGCAYLKILPHPVGNAHKSNPTADLCTAVLWLRLPLGYFQSLCELRLWAYHNYRATDL